VNPVRGIVAILLVALFSLSLIAPVVLASDTDGSVPACCRRTGEHGCVMKAGASSPGASLRTARCRLFPPAKAIPPGRAIGLPTISQAIFAALLRDPASRSQTEALYRISYSRSQQVRGPPYTLFLAGC
jgi:hypothetical protein